MDIEKDYSYRILKNLAIYLELRSVRKSSKIKRYERVMKKINIQKKFMETIRDEYNLVRYGINKKKILDDFVIKHISENKDFLYDELRLLWD